MPKKTTAAKKSSAKRKSREFLVVVDGSEEMPLALHYACYRAAKTKGAVALLTIIDNSADFQHWLGIGNLHRDELVTEAKALMKELSEQVKKLTGNNPKTYIRQGEKGPELYSLLQEEKSIKVVVIAAGTSSDGPGPIINYAMNKGIDTLPRPFIIIPGNMTIEDIAEIT